MSDRILTTHAGSLPRPDSLLPLVFAQERGERVDEEQLGLEIRTAVQAIVARQHDVGVDVLNDGEVSKPSYATYVKDRLTGFGGEGSIADVAATVQVLDDFPDFVRRQTELQTYPTEIKFTSCDGPVTYIGHTALQTDIENLRDATTHTEPTGTFMSAASPGVISVFSPNRYYASEDAYLEAVANAMREEYAAIHAAGFTLQLDCPDFAMTAPSAGSLQAFRRQLERSVEALNYALTDIPAESARIHVCWGNDEFPRTTDVELKDIIDIILKAKPAGLMLMASNGRHEHEWRVFADIELPEGKYLIPGVLDTSTNIVEHPEVVADRLARYASVVGAANVMAGTDCGFGTLAGMQLVAPTVVWTKLRSMAQGAELATKRIVKA